MTMRNWEEVAGTLQTNLEYSFHRLELLREACTHSTYSYEHKTRCNERLEFLGDSVLGLSVCHRLYTDQPRLQEGVMSKYKSRLVCEQTLARVACELHLDQALLLGNGEEASGGRRKDSNLADALEAVLGAVFLDAGFEVAQALVFRLLDKYFVLAYKGGLIYDYKSALLEKVQQHHHSSDLEFRVLESSGPAHAPAFTIGIYLCGRFLASAKGSNKKEAEQAAAKQALEIDL